MRQKKYLLRSAVYVLLLAVVYGVPFALAQRNSNKISSAADRRQLPTRASGPVGVTTPTPTPTPGPCQFQVLIVFADAVPPTQFQAEIQAEPNVTVVDLFDASSATPTLDQLQQYDIVVP